MQVRLLLSIGLFCSTLLVGGPAFAQAEKAPPYEAPMLRLSEIMGSLHFLTLLCRPEEGQLWHVKMQQLLKAEGKTPLRRAKLVDSFNTGFDDFQSTYRKCTNTAETALNRYFDEAQVIVRNLTSDFAG